MYLFNLILFTSFIQLNLLPDLRNVYLSQDENRITKMYEILKDKDSRSADEDCYFAVFECLQAKYTYNPYSKYSYFKSGFNRLNVLIKKYPTNAEYRYHRIMIEKNAPTFLIEVNHQSEDKAILKKHLDTEHPLYQAMVKTVE